MAKNFIAHNHEHDLKHDHNHNHGANAPFKVLIMAVILTLAFSCIEALGGWLAGSLVLLSDAGHMASDSLALAISAFAAWISLRPPSAQHSYGLGRAEVISAWISSLLMIGVVIAIILEAIERFHNPPPVSGGLVMGIASFGLILNLSIAWILSRGEATLNIRGAILHVMGDLFGSVAALISGAVVYFKGWTLIDPISSIFICILILFSSWQLLRESLLVLMEGVPAHINLQEVGGAMASIDKVKSIHDLHIWTLSSGVTVLSAHVQIDESSQWDNVLRDLRKLLAEKYSIDHVTLQPETRLEITQPPPFKPGCKC